MPASTKDVGWPWSPGRRRVTWFRVVGQAGRWPPPAGDLFWVVVWKPCWMRAQWSGRRRVRPTAGAVTFAAGLVGGAVAPKVEDSEAGCWVLGPKLSGRSWCRGEVVNPRRTVIGCWRFLGDHHHLPRRSRPCGQRPVGAVLVRWRGQQAAREPVDILRAVRRAHHPVVRDHRHGPVAKAPFSAWSTSLHGLVIFKLS